MHIQPPFFQLKDSTYSHPVLYGEYINHTLYLVHPDKKIALNISPDKLDYFLDTLHQNIQKNLQTEAPLLYLKSFELIAKQNNLKVKKRKKLLPEATFLIPSQINQEKIIHIDKPVQFTPINSPIHFDYPRPDKKNFLNQIQQLQKKLNSTKHEINFKYIYHSKQSDQEILSEQNYQTPLYFRSPDFSILANLSQTDTPQQTNTNQGILFTEDHPRNFQKGVLKIYTSKKTTNYKLEETTEIIQTNVQKNLTTKINQKTKAFSIYKKLCSQINNQSNA